MLLSGNVTDVGGLLKQSTKDLPLLSGGVNYLNTTYVDVVGDSNKLPFRVSDTYNPTNKLLWFNINILFEDFVGKGWIELANNDLSGTIQRYNVDPLLGSNFWNPTYFFNKQEKYLISFMNADNSLLTINGADGHNGAIVKFNLDLEDITNTTWEIIGEAAQVTLSSLADSKNNILHYDHNTNIVQVLVANSNKLLNSRYVTIDLNTNTVIRDNTLPDSLLGVSFDILESNAYVSESEIYLWSINNLLSGSINGNVNYVRYNSITNTIEKEVTVPKPVSGTNSGMRVWHHSQENGIIERVGSIENLGAMISERFNLNNETIMPSRDLVSIRGRTSATFGGSYFKDVETNILYAKVDNFSAYLSDLRYFYEFKLSQVNKDLPLLSGDVGLVGGLLKQINKK